MKKIALAAALAFTGSTVNALTIDTVITESTWTQAQLNGVPWGGAFVKMKLLTDVTGTILDWLPDEFYAMCVEWQQTTALNTVFSYDVVPLEDAPNSTGGMGNLNANWSDAVFQATPYNTMDDLANKPIQEISAIQMTLWESANETSNQFNWDSGSAVLTGQGDSFKNRYTLAANSLFSPDIMSFGLVNDRKQDFAIFKRVPVVPTIALFGLGLIAMRLVK